MTYYIKDTLELSKIAADCRDPQNTTLIFADQKNGYVWCTENFPRNEKFVKCDWPTQI
jgi:hypothetical protein